MPTPVSEAPITAAPDEPARPRRRRLARVALAGGGIALLVLLTQGRGSVPAVPAASAETPAAPAWRTARPALPLALTAPRFHIDDLEALEPVRAEPGRLNPASGQREDVLLQGEFAGIDVPYLRLTLTETPGDEPEQSLFVTLARRAAEAQGLAVLRAGERGVIATKFGAVETLDVTLGGNGKRICTGFISRQPGPLRLDGWLCAPLGQAPVACAVACTLDKVALNGQAWPDGEAAFVRLERRRDPDCSPRTVTDREGTSETGSIPLRRTRKNEAKLRPSGQARP